MNAELQAISYSELIALIEDWWEGPDITEFARLADPLFEAWLGPVLLGFIGFIPRSTLSDTAYIWVHTTSNAARHPMAVARLARRWLPIFHSRYPNLHGHCFTAPARNWLRTLGARFWPNNVFTIEASHG
jgi:hypothetical protein